jgi:superfamily I DNA/RNA helicase
MGLDNAELLVNWREEVLYRQRSFFATYQTKSLKFRLENLMRFKKAVKKYEKRITEFLNEMRTILGLKCKTLQQRMPA